MTMNVCSARLCHGPLSLPTNEDVNAVLAMQARGAEERILCAAPVRGGKGREAAYTLQNHQEGEGFVPPQSYDAIVVGSGISGGWAAKELTEKGLQVLLLERGKNIEHVKDYLNATKGPWEYPHRGGRTRAMEAAYPVLKRDYPLNEKNLDWWCSDQESP